MLSPENEAAAQMQAASLWQFVHLKTPLFPHSAALEVIQKLSVSPGEDLKQVAKRLRKELASHGVHMQHTAALDAAARIAGHKGWFDAAKKQEQPHRLTAYTVTNANINQSPMAEWDNVRPLMRSICEAWHRDHGTTVFEVKPSRNCLLIAAQTVLADENGPRFHSDTLLSVTPAHPGGDAEWLQGVQPSIEALRRCLEETGKATLDGVAVIQASDSMDDAMHSELVLRQGSHELDLGFELARGDEVECWAQLELALEGDCTKAVIDETDGTWILGNRRFMWDVATIRPKHEYGPQLSTKNLNVEASKRLFRRYQLTTGRTPGALRAKQAAKQLEFLGAPAERYRVDLHRLLRELNLKGLEWDDYCEIAGETVAMDSLLPTGFIIGLIQYLDLPDPSIAFARPPRSELALATDDKLLNVLLPRVSHVRYRIAKDISEDSKTAVKVAIEELSSSIWVRMMGGGNGFVSEKDALPQLVYSDDGRNLLGALADENLVVYVGVLPYLKRIDKMERIENSLPFAFGHSLYLDIDQVGAVV
ncbi:MAG: glyoxalase superfamily protein [Pseudomonadota bacterium]